VVAKGEYRPIEVVSQFLFEMPVDERPGGRSPTEVNVWLATDQFDLETANDLATIICEKDNVAPGETTVCTVSCRIGRNDLQVFHWYVEGTDAAAWPGQVP